MSLKRAVTAVVLLLSAPAVFAGVAYRFTTVTTGFAEQRMSGSVEAEGSRMRVNIDAAEGTSYPNGTFILIDGNRLSLGIPTTKTYYDFTMDPLAPMKAMFGDAASVANEHSSVRDLGNGHSITRSSYDLNVALMDKKIKMHVDVTTESWSTDKYPASAGIGRMLTPDRKPTGFPLKQVSTMHVDQNGQPFEVKSTTTVTDVVTKPIPATDLAMPPGYRKVESPIERAMKSLGK